MRVTLSCERVRSLASAYRDGALPPQSGDAVGRHLEDCPDCQAEMASFRALAEAVRDLPTQPLSADFADRLHRSHQERMEVLRRRPRHNPWIHRAAAAALFALSLGFAYSLGHLRGSGTELGSRPQPSGNESPKLSASWQDYADENFDPMRFVRGTRALARDVAVIDQISPELRQPVVASQLRILGLDRQATNWQRLRQDHGGDPVLDLAAHFVSELRRGVHADLASTQGHQVFRFPQQEARRILRELPSHPPRPWRASSFAQNAKERDRIIAEMAPRLPKPLRSSLEDFLALRESWVDGELSIAIERAQRRRGHERTHDPLEILEMHTLMSSLIAAGRRKEAAELIGFPPSFFSKTQIPDCDISIEDEGLNFRFIIKGHSPLNIDLRRRAFPKRK